MCICTYEKKPPIFHDSRRLVFCEKIVSRKATRDDWSTATEANRLICTRWRVPRSIMTAATFGATFRTRVALRLSEGLPPTTPSIPPVGNFRATFEWKVESKRVPDSRNPVSIYLARSRLSCSEKGWNTIFVIETMLSLARGIFRFRAVAVEFTPPELITFSAYPIGVSIRIRTGKSRLT